MDRKPYVLGDSNAPSPRRARQEFEDPTELLPSPAFRWKPGLDQGQAPTQDVPLPTERLNTKRPFRLG